MAYIPGMEVHAPPAGPGWYRPPEGPIRWWDGRRWSGGAIDERGAPSLDVWVGHLTPARCWFFASYNLFFAALLLGIGVMVWVTSGVPVMVVPGTLFLGLAGYWLMLAVRAGAIAKIPAPLSQPLLLPQVRPLPTDVEGPSAGWYEAPSRHQLRWWTGARWAEYVVARGRYLPAYGMSVIVGRNNRFMFWAMMGGLAALTVGLGLLALALFTGSDVLWWITMWLPVLGFTTALVTVIVRPIANRQARRLGIPDHAPAGPPVQTAAPA